MAINEATFQQFLGKMLDDAGAAMGSGWCYWAISLVCKRRS